MKVAILGAGAVGLGLAATLHEASASVRLFTRPENPQPELAPHGLRREGLFGEIQTPPGAIPTKSSLASLQSDPADFLMLCTKTPAIPEVARQVGRVWPILNPKPIVVLCQNGWGARNAWPNSFRPATSSARESSPVFPGRHRAA